MKCLSLKIVSVLSLSTTTLLTIASPAQAIIPTPALLEHAFPGTTVGGFVPAEFVPISLSVARTWGNPNGIEVVFTAAVSPASATNKNNYTVSSGITVTAARLGTNASTVLLTTTTLPDDALHTVQVSGVQDTLGNTITAGSTIAVLKGQGITTRKVFLGVTGGLAGLTANTNFPNNPNSSEWRDALESPQNFADNYGQQFVGYVHPPITGDYYFFVSGDEQTQLFLSTDRSAANKSLIASNPAAIGFRQWSVASRSADVRLEAGRSYYFEARQWEGGGADHISVTWRLRGLANPVDGDGPIPGGYLSTLVPNGAAGIAVAPTNTSVGELQGAAFSVIATGTPPWRYQWLKNGNAIPGSTNFDHVITAAPLSDSNAQFRVVVSNSFSAVTSSVAVLTVLPDRAGPRLTRLGGNATLDRVSLSFNERVSTLTANNPRNYNLSGGLVVNYAQLLPDGTNVILATSAQTPGQNYSLTVTGVTDTAASRNLANTTSNFTAWILCRGFLRREVFPNIGGDFLDDLMNSVRFPDAPGSADYPALSETPSNIGENYGTRLLGYLLPPTNGYYRFFMSSDGQGVLYLSTDENPANKVQIAAEPAWNGVRNWVVPDRRTAGNPENISGNILLEAGRRYYVEAVMKESTSSDNLGFTWQLPGAPLPANGDLPITAPFLAAYASASGVGLSITQQPVSVTIAETLATNFSVMATSTYAPIFYQWQRNGVDIPGANAATYATPRLLRTDQGVQFRCLVSVPGRCLTSSVATVTVTLDNAVPTLVSAASLWGAANIGVCFSELLQTASATNPANYVLSTGATITNVILRPDGRSVQLQAASFTYTNFTLRVSNVRDFAGNLIAANSSTPVAVQSLDNTDVGTPGDPSTPGSVFTCKAGEFDLVAGGSDMWNAQDHFQFAYEPRDGDFDVAVRVAQIDNGAQWARAVLHASENLSTGSRRVYAGSSPANGANQMYLAYRGAQDGTTTEWGGYTRPAPLPYPNHWMRLARTNNTFYGWRGTNGSNWTFIASLTDTNFPRRLLVGLGGMSYNNAVGATSSNLLRDFSALPRVTNSILDLTLRRASNGAYAGGNLYQVIPAGTQVLSLLATNSLPALTQLRVENDGVVTQSVILRATASPEPGWTIRFLSGTNDVSAALLGTNGYALTNLAPAALSDLVCEIRPGAGVAGNTFKSVVISAFAARGTGGALRDSVQIIVRNDSGYQPDLQVRRLSDVVSIGNDIYNTTGLNQTKSQPSDYYLTATYVIQVSNDGNLTNAFRLFGTDGAGGWNVRYLDALIGGVDVSGDLTVAGLPVYLPPGGSFEFRVEVTPNLSVPRGASNVLSISAFSEAFPARTDVVKVATVLPLLTNVPQSRVFTSNADFEEGTLIGTAYASNQLSLSSQPVTLPFIWVPNANEGTISKVDTRTGREVGRYRVAPAALASSANPSRTTVDLLGNCWVGNRQIGTVVKVGLLESGQWIDRNGNGVPDTSTDLNGDGDITGAELLGWGLDECVLVEFSVKPGMEMAFTPGAPSIPYFNDYWNPGPRGLAVDALGNLWIGTYTSQKFYYIDGNTGALLKTVDFTPVVHNSYGAVIDRNGIVWSAGVSQNNVMRLDPNTLAYTIIPIGHIVYGVNLDRNGHLFINGWQSSKLSRLDTATSALEWTVAAPYEGRGVATTDDGDVWSANSGPGQVNRFSNDGVLKATITVGNQPTGVSVDAAGKVWVVNFGDEYIKRIDPALNAVDLSKRIVGGLHYGYSDMTGIIARNVTSRFGTWSAIHDAQLELAPWGTVLWTAFEPNGTGSNITVRVRSSSNRINWSGWETAVNNQALTNTPPGRWLQVEATLRASITGDAPVLYDLTVRPATQRNADVSITQTLATSPLLQDRLYTNVISITNRGPQDARGVFMTNSFPPGAYVLSATPTTGTVTESNAFVRWDLGNLAFRSNVTLTVILSSTNGGSFSNLVRVLHYEADANLANNVSAVPLVVTGIPCAPPVPGLVGWWTAQDTAIDLIGTNHGTLGAGVSYTAGRVGRAFQFMESADSFVQFPNGPAWHPTNNQFTIEAWIKSDLKNTGNKLDTILMKRDGCGYFAYAFGVGRGHLGYTGEVYVGAGNASFWSTNRVPNDGLFHHVAFTYNGAVGTNSRIYIDGLPAGSGNCAASIAAIAGAPVMGKHAECGFYSSAAIDELSFYQRALSAAEIQAIVAAGSSGKCRDTSTTPRLDILPAAGGGYRISWPVTAPAFALVFKDRLSDPAWLNWPTPPTLVGNRFVVTVQANVATRFFRLRNP